MLAPSLAFCQARVAPLPAHAPAGTPAVAKVNGVRLTEADLRGEMEQLFPYYSAHGGRLPAKAEPEIRRKALDAMVLKELLYQEAKRRKLQVSAAEIKERMEKARSTFSGTVPFEYAATQKYGSVEQLRGQIRRALLVEKLWNKEVVGPSRVTEAEARTYYREHRQRFVRPESVWLQSISFLVSEPAAAQDRERLRAAAEQVLPRARAAKSHAEFGALAEKFSMDDWRVMNGDHRWVHRGTLDPALEIAFAMKPGDTSGIVPSAAGFHILRVNGYRPETPLPYGEVRQTARQALEKERLGKRRERFENQLRAAAGIEFP